jgi:hypothetical protein
MVKAEYALKYLLENKVLSRLCKILNIDYKYIHSVTTHIHNASANIQKALSPVIPPSYWYEEADNCFCENIKTEISPLFADKSLNLL